MPVMATTRTPKRANTLAIDIGGTGLKASVLDQAGTMISDRVREETTYPMTPAHLVDRLVALTAPLPAYDRVSVGFPGVVRHGTIVSAPHFVTKRGPGSKTVPELVAAWTGFDLTGALVARLAKPVRTINDADLQGLDVVGGFGVELVVTLGTGVGTAIFVGGKIGPRVELAHHEFHDGQSYNDYLGDAARNRIGNKRFNKRVRRLVIVLDALCFYDHLYIGGGNARHITGRLNDNVTIIDPNAGILGGLKLWGLADPG